MITINSFIMFELAIIFAMYLGPGLSLSIIQWWHDWDWLHLTCITHDVFWNEDEEEYVFKCDFRYDYNCAFFLLWSILWPLILIILFVKNTITIPAHQLKKRKSKKHVRVYNIPHDGMRE